MGLAQKVCFRLDFVLCRRIMLFILKFHFRKRHEWRFLAWGSVSSRIKPAGCAYNLLGLFLLIRALQLCSGRSSKSSSKIISYIKQLILACPFWYNFLFFFSCRRSGHSIISSGRLLYQQCIFSCSYIYHSILNILTFLAFLRQPMMMLPKGEKSLTAA